ncbi:MAG: hypothetical protein KBF13_02640 [Prevotella sp.]|nr:hypothetical protein [Prevotella sp.]
MGIIKPQTIGITAAYQWFSMPRCQSKRYVSNYVFQRLLGENQLNRTVC